MNEVVADNKPVGAMKGKKNYPNGDNYEGELIDGKPNGYGI